MTPPGRSPVHRYARPYEWGIAADWQRCSVSVREEFVEQLPLCGGEMLGERLAPLEDGHVGAGVGRVTRRRQPAEPAPDDDHRFGIEVASGHRFGST